MRFFTSESVTEGHPDKVADAISDAILDCALKGDPDARVACETVVTTNTVFVTGEITTKTKIDYDFVIRETIRKIGYNKPSQGFSYDTVEIILRIDEQSPDIALGVNKTSIKEQGAGDQGLMFGYASNETEEYMPLAISLAHKLSERLAMIRKNKLIDGLGPDGKTQVTVEYDSLGKPIRIDSLVLSTQHDEETDLRALKLEIKEMVLKPIVPLKLIDENTKFYINPTGRFVIGGPAGDAGLTGRKLIVDSYGGYARHGGGAFSGKDPSKVDRSAAYMARYLAKNIVASGAAERCEIQLSYAIGVANPTSVTIETFRTSKVKEEKLRQIILKNFDLSPQGIIEFLDLKRPIYSLTTNYGHFGRELPELTWEKIDSILLFK